jgi:CRISPR-associated Csx10 family RAMP protein
MNRYRLTARLLSPLVVRKERQSQRSEGASSLSGTLVRGALARLYLEQYGSADQRFRELFVEEEGCRFGPLDPGLAVFPRSAATCKRYGGFLADSTDKEPKHGVVDLLYPLIARRLLGGELPEAWRIATVQCTRCRNDLKPKDGFWRRDGERIRDASSQLLRGTEMHVGIDRVTHSAHESILYSLPTLEPNANDSVLTGWIETTEERRRQLQALLDEEDGEIRIGHARTRGYGRVRLDIAEPLSPPEKDWQGWSQALIDYLGKIGDSRLSFDPQRHFFFALGLPSGAILLDRLLRYSLDPAGMVPWLPPLPPADALRPVLEFPATDYEGGKLWCLTAVTGHERLRGWQVVQGLPRQDEWFVNRGAVYAYLFEGEQTARERLLSQLTELEATGLGARRGEGFGQVIISDEFHRWFLQQG